MGKLPGMDIGGLEIETCIIQGGMGVKISLNGLASAVANEGGVGNIASVGLGEPKDFRSGYAMANAAGLRREIEKTREMTDGVFGINVMDALSDSDELVDVVVEEKVPLLFMGAGFKPELPEKIKGTDTMAVPVISYAKFIPTILKEWGKYDYRPAAIVIEGPKAGGHLGYGMKRLEKEGFIEGCLEKEVRRAVEVVDGKIPIIAAGGIYTGGDIYQIMQLGASGVQMGTRFVTTDECDADVRFKEAYLDAKEKDIVLIDSPVGFPGRAINNEYLKNIEKGGKVACPYVCLKDCGREEAAYCIAKALDNAGKGNLDKGFAFAGANAYRCDEIIPVKELMDTWKEEYAEAKNLAE
jgi:nitronate monooxygenase